MAEINLLPVAGGPSPEGEGARTEGGDATAQTVVRFAASCGNGATRAVFGRDFARVRRRVAA